MLAKGSFICPGCKAPLKSSRSVAAHSQNHPECTDEMRMWGRIDKNGPGGCWIWTGYKNYMGYAAMQIKGKKMVAVHRFLYQQVHGPIDPKLHVCHKCDRPLCVNPEHLFVGTNMDNVKDKMAKRRCANQYFRDAGQGPELAYPRFHRNRGKKREMEPA